MFWWNGLAAQDALPGTWEELKVAMRDRFVPPSYHRDLRKKLFACMVCLLLLFQIAMQNS